MIKDEAEQINKSQIMKDSVHYVQIMSIMFWSLNFRWGVLERCLKPPEWLELKILTPPRVVEDVE